MNNKFYLESYIYNEITNLGYNVYDVLVKRSGLFKRSGLYSVEIIWRNESISKQLSMSFKWETNDEESFNKVVQDAVKFFQKNRPSEENLAMMDEALE